MIEQATAADRPAIEALLELCNEQDGLELTIEPSGEGFLWRENDEVAGFVGFDGRREVEATAMVHPAHRRRGIGRALIDALREECARRGTEALFLVVDEASPSARPFVQAIGGDYDKSEYRMLLDPDAAPTRSWSSPLQLEEVGIDSVGLFSTVMAEAFGDPVTRARAWLEKDMQSPDRRFWVARAGAEPVGTVRVYALPEGTYITALGVLSGYRGRGYGRQILSRTVAMLRDEGREPILLEVETENQNALGLYRSCGFEVTRTYGFYRL